MGSGTAHAHRQRVMGSRFDFRDLIKLTLAERGDHHHTRSRPQRAFGNIRSVDNPKIISRSQTV